MKAQQKTFSLREVTRRVRFPSVTSNPCFDFLPFHATLSILKYPYNECTVGLRFVSQMMTFQAATDLITRIRYPLLFCKTYATFEEKLNEALNNAGQRDEKRGNWRREKEIVKPVHLIITAVFLGWNSRFFRVVAVTINVFSYQEKRPEFENNRYCFVLLFLIVSCLLRTKTINVKQ